jgi:CHAT domain-containing protein
MQLETTIYPHHPLFRSKLLLAGANSDPGMGQLTALEIAGLDLRGLDMAVLSACDTGLGTLQGGEGVQGLQQAFHQAGCRGLVASLWRIHDGASAVLMEEFYRNLWQKKMTKVEALRQAQIHLLHHPELIARMEKVLNQKLTQRGLPTAADELALSAVALAGLNATGLGQPGCLSAALVTAAPVPGGGWRGPGSRVAPLLPGGGVGPRNTHPAYWAAFVLSGDLR